MDSKDKSNVSSLVDTCIRRVANIYSKYKLDLHMLPIPMKNRMLSILSKRGLLDETSLEQLANRDTVKLELTSCELTESVLAKLKVCKNLMKLDLDANKGVRLDVNDKGLISLLPHLTNLREIQLRRCDLLTDAAVDALARFCGANLVIVSLHSCSKVTDRGLESLAAHCPKLRAINVANTNVTDNGIFTLSQSSCASSISEVQLDGCKAITDESIEALAMYCSRIKILTYANCPKVTDNARIALEELFQNSGQQMRQLTWTVY